MNSSEEIFTKTAAKDNLTTAVTSEGILANITQVLINSASYPLPKDFWPALH